MLPGDSSWSPREVGGGEGALLGITWYLEQRGRGLGFESPQENVKESQRQIYPGRFTQASGGHSNDFLAPGSCKAKP